MVVVVVSAEEEELWVDLRPYCNPSIYYVTEDSSVTKVPTTTDPRQKTGRRAHSVTAAAGGVVQVYRVFRGLGLRHLLVLNAERHISGVIARSVLLLGR